MMRLISVVFLFLLGLSNSYAVQIRTYISYDKNGFYNYNRSSNEVLFTENRFWRTSDGKSKSNSISYRVDLNEKRLLMSYRYGEGIGSCIGLHAKRSRDDEFIVSYDPESNGIKLLNIETNDCTSLSGRKYLGVSRWSGDGDAFVINDRYSKVFRLLDPSSLNVKEYADDNNRPRMVLWSEELKTNLFVFTPSDSEGVEPSERTSDDYRFLYIDDNGEWRQYEGEAPLKTPGLEYTYKMRSDIEVAPWTEFTNINSGAVQSAPEYFFLGADRWHAVWLEDGWVYFQGAPGVFNYQSGEFVTFGGDEESPVIPFSVSDDRFAIMYHQHEDRLKVYDLVKREYTESYEPFWRKQ